ncbi:MAG: nucleotidyltransferase domain-containing protein [Anaerolineales bacterium]
MADKRIVKSIQDYLQAVNQKGIPVKYGVLFGSYARGQEHEWSDIDLLVVSPRYDRKWTHKDWAKLWLIAANTDVRIEPIPVGEKQYQQDDSSAIIDIARREGQVIPLAE